jgi:hypothetical protein
VANDDDAEFFAFRRTLGSERIWVAFNRGDQEFKWKLPREARTTLEAELATERFGVEVRPTDDGVVVTVPAMSGVVLTEPQS